MKLVAAVKVLIEDVNLQPFFFFFKQSMKQTPPDFNFTCLCPFIAFQQLFGLFTYCKNSYPFSHNIES